MKHFKLFIIWPLFFLSCQRNPDTRPNVLFIAVDDLNDWITLFDANNPIRTPNLERLASKGVFFTHAYCSSPACNPSRASLLTGTRPHKTGIYGNKSDWRKALPQTETIQQYFMNHGYFSAGAGKIFHHHWDGAFHDTASFHEFQPMPDTYPDSPLPARKLNGFEWYGSKNTDWGAWPLAVGDAVDYRTVSYAGDFLDRAHEEPFFLSIGIFRPHMPGYSPPQYREKYPVENAVMPVVKANDWDDLPSGAAQLLEPSKWFWQGMERAIAEDPQAWADMVTSYQAAASFADAQIGRLLDALEQSPYADNTVIVLWSDHGYHLGEKQHMEKFALWEKTTHVPFIVVAPGQIKPGTTIHTPIDLTTVYPTLIDLCGLPARSGLDGYSVLPLLEDSTASFPPALMTYMEGNHAIRTARWRYIRYADGTEELYDHTKDGHEWNNLAVDTHYLAVLDSLRPFVPSSSAVAVADMVKPSRVIQTEYRGDSNVVR
ncbi:sulfatase [Parapedobacter indicus]|uniref:Arylsulfatase A n=1 Tax=Parapedobacter indicus TaxID=1477437 RepID=A0A1I3D9G7_9SPHI|nr:sulfatase [Parapedobacter indicus]PPL04582.1 arylsulfatase A-like enzyme [Parapedobacter indicus]SFH83392.1 Arylsulfatase A [Parapedobacter indicus]